MPNDGAANDLFNDAKPKDLFNDANPMTLIINAMTETFDYMTASFILVIVILLSKFANVKFRSLYYDLNLISSKRKLQNQR
jgi:hypothetical protein